MNSKQTKPRRKSMPGPWIALYLLSMSWLFSMPYYADPNRWISLCLLAATVIILWRIPDLGSTENAGNTHALWAVIAVPALIVLPGYYKAVPALLILAVAAGRLGANRKSLRFLSSGLVVCAMILLWQFPVEKLLDVILARFHEAPVIDAILFRIVTFFGLPASLSDGTIFIQMMEELEPMLVTWEKLGILPIFYVSAGALGILFIVRPRNILRIFVTFSAVTVIFMIMRGAFMILLFYTLMYFLPFESEYNFVTIFWNPVVLAVTFLPLPFFLEALNPLSVSVPGGGAEKGYTGTPLRKENARRKGQSSIRRIPASPWFLLPLILLCAGLFLLVGAYGFHDPGTLKEGRVLVDDSHNEWERIDKPYDTEWYGPDSGYNYYCIMDYLNHYYEVEYADTLITGELLENYDVLIVRIPTSRFDPGEIAAIKRFVEDGGGLYLIGDHTNVFGSGVYLNDIAREFGFLYRYDCVFDIQKVFEELYYPPSVLPHPILRKMPHLLFHTSCSILPLSPTYGGAITGNKTKSLDIDYSSENFYPQVDDTPLMKYGPFLQMIVKHHGKGRIAGFTDSTIFSNFAAFYPGTSELFLYTVDWLNRSNKLNRLTLLMAVLGIGATLIALLCMMFRKNLLRNATVSISTVLFSISLSIILFGYITRMSYKSLEPRSRVRTVVFDLDHCDYLLPVYSIVANPMKDYSVFFQWILRLGYFPKVAVTGNEIGDWTDLVVLIKPNKPVSTAYKKKITDYVASGGNLLIMDAPPSSASSANSILDAFGIQFITDRPVKISNIINETGDTLTSVYRAFPGWEIRGGTKVYLTNENKTVGVRSIHGEGSVTAIGFPRLFANIFMGYDQSVYPSDGQLEYYNLEFNLIRGIVERMGEG